MQYSESRNKLHACLTFMSLCGANQETIERQVDHLYSQFVETREEVEQGIEDYAQSIIQHGGNKRFACKLLLAIGRIAPVSQVI